MSLYDWLPWRRARRASELAEELRTHLELAVADRIARGESPESAAANARRELGNAGLIQELARDQWGPAAMWAERLGQDVRFALRLLRRSPGFTATAVLTMALGIGASASIFSVVDAAILRPLPYAHAGQLVRIEDDFDGTGARDVGMSTPEWKDLQRSGVFAAVSPTWFDNNNLTGLLRAQRVSILIVAPNYFSLLGARAQLGAVFDPNDPTPGFNGDVVISDGLWKRTFGAAPGVIGRVVQLDSDSYRIVGVMPPGFQAPERTTEARRTDVWVAMGFAGAPITTSNLRTPLFPGAIARVRSDLTIAEAQRRVDALVHSLQLQFAADYPAGAQWRVRLVPLHDYVVGDLRQPLLFLLGAVALVLVIACANVANLLLARATTRARELAVRQAMGSTASRLTRQLLTESLVLSLCGGALGIVLVYLAREPLARLVPDAVPQLNAVAIDWRGVLLAFGVALAAGVLFGLAPAWHVRRLDLTSVLKSEGRGSTGSGEQVRMRRALVITECALSLTLMIAAALLVRSFRQLLDVPMGFEPRAVTVVRTRLPYPNDSTEDLYGSVGAEASFAREVVRRAKSIAGVTDVALGSGAAVPLDHPEQDQVVLRVAIEGRTTPGHQPLLVTGSEVTPGYFRLLGIPLVRGRLPNDFDTDSTPSVAVVNESMARLYWPNEEVIGRRFKVVRRVTQWTTIVGVVGDTRSESLTEPQHPQIYLSLYQRQGKHLAIFVRGRVAPAALERDLRGEIQAINPALPVFGAKTLSDAVAASLATRRFAMAMIAAFAVVAMLLSGLGIYGVISYVVGERIQEIGVRLALGAQRGDVLRSVLREGMVLELSGVVPGIVGALAVARVMSGVLYGVRPWDPVTFVGVTSALTLVALAACYFPARRAVAVDPIVAMRG